MVGYYSQNTALFMCIFFVLLWSHFDITQEAAMNCSEWQFTLVSPGFGRDLPNVNIANLNAVHLPWYSRPLGWRQAFGDVSYTVFTTYTYVTAPGSTYNYFYYRKIGLAQSTTAKKIRNFLGQINPNCHARRQIKQKKIEVSCNDLWHIYETVRD